MRLSPPRRRGARLGKGGGGRFGAFGGEAVNLAVALAQIETRRSDLKPSFACSPIATPIEVRQDRLEARLELRPGRGASHVPKSAHQHLGSASACARRRSLARSSIARTRSPSSARRSRERDAIANDIL